MKQFVVDLFQRLFRSGWRAHTPLVIQMQAAECGAASLGIVLGYYKKFVSLAELRYRCSIARDGSSALDLVKAARYYGLEAEGRGIDLFGLEALRAPAILLWQSNHYVVFEGFDRKHVFINDPAYGPIAYSKEAFHAHFSGVALLFEPSAAFVPSEEPVGFWRRLKRHYYHGPALLLFMLLSGIALFFPSLIVPMTLRLWIDHFHLNIGMIENQAGWISCLALIVSIGALGHYYYHFVIQKIASTIGSRFASDLVFRLLRLPFSFYQQRDPRELVGRMVLSDEMGRIIVGEFFPLLIQLILSFFYAALLFNYDTWIASIVLIGSLLALCATYAIYRVRRSHDAAFHRDWELSETAALDNLHAFDTIKTMGAEAFFLDRWRQLYTRFLNAEQKIEKLSVFLNIFPVFLQAFCIALMIGTSSRDLLSGKLSLGMLAAMVVILMFFLSSLAKVIEVAGKMAHVRRHLGHLEDITHASFDPMGSKEGEILFDEAIELEFHSVSFGYDPTPPLQIECLSFKVSSGMWLGIKGPVASGKSTVGRLAAGLIYPTQGEILYNKKRKDEMSSSSFHRRVSWVSAEPSLFAGTIRDNLTFWDRTLTDELLASRITDQWVLEHLDSRVQQEGMNLSFSEKMRIEIARALMTQPALLIMDGEMNGLDSETQKDILRQIETMRSTCLWLTTDEALLAECDAIITLEKGRS
ncbi:MAG: ATP-binding cassette domain-containing protein [Rhabdochlamydiaceae bacterium]|nr:ATP-binding cassette domain-containing protein [Rhabdochlamydiaceae bacterium]